MRFLQALRLRLRALFRPDRVRGELDRELQFHLDQQVQELRAAGMSPEAARAQALRQFGNVGVIREECREHFGWAVLHGIFQDTGYAMRTIVRTPGFALAVASLALAIGATAAVHRTADWLLNRSPGGVVDADRLAGVAQTDKDQPSAGAFGLSMPQFVRLRDMQTAFVDLAAFSKMVGVISSDLGADQVVLEFVTGNYFQMLGVRPALGRLIRAEDDRAGVPPIAVLSDRFWRVRFGGDPSVIGRTVRLNGQSARVVGVTPREFEGYALTWNGQTSVWLAVQALPALGQGALLTAPTSAFTVVGRLRPDIPLAEAHRQAPDWYAELPRLGDAIRTWTPSTLIVRRDSEMRLRTWERTTAKDFLGVLLAISVLTWAAACFNLSNFLMGRMVTRRAELALRAALGASRARLARQLATEATFLGVCAVALSLPVGLGVAAFLSPLPYVYLGILARGAPLTTPMGIDGHLITTALVLGVGAALTFGLLPAVVSLRRDPIRDLKNPKPHWTWSGMRFNTRQVVLVLQVALSVALAIGAGLFARSFARAASVTSDYDRPEAVLVARLAPAGMSGQQRETFFRELLARLNSHPGVVSASIGWNPPFRGGNNYYRLPGREDDVVFAGATAVAPRFFDAQGARIVRGRDFEDSAEDLREAVVVNRVLAERLWPDTDPIGQAVQYGAVRRVVVGVAADDHCNDLLGPPSPCGWQPFPGTSGLGYLRVRTRGEPLAFVPDVKALVREIHPDAALSEEWTLANYIRDETGRQRTAVLASASLAFFGVLLVGFGCVSLFISMVRGSVREIAIRLALGASPGRLVRRVLLQAVPITGAGLILGIGAGYAVSRRIGEELYRIDASDSLTFILAPTAIAVIAFAAASYAASEVAKTDPARYLKAE